MGHGTQGTELYDRKNDPGEFTNLVENPKYAAMLDQLQKRLLEVRKEAGFDPSKHQKNPIKKK
jgi:hypothetical protein